MGAPPMGAKTEHENTTQNGQNTWKSSISSVKNITRRLKHEDEINESHKSQLTFEYDVHLLNYTVNIFKTLKTYMGLLRVFLGFF